MINLIGIPGGYGPRDPNYKHPDLIKGQESLNMFGEQQRQRMLGQDEQRKSQARGTLAEQLSQPVEPSLIDEAEVRQQIQKFKMANPNFQHIADDDMYNKFMEQRMMPRKQQQARDLARSQTDLGGYLSQQSKPTKDPSEVNRHKVAAVMYSLKGKITQDTASGINTDSERELLERLRKEMSQDSPSLQRAFQDSGSPPPDGIQGATQGGKAPAFYDESGKFQTLSDRDVGLLQAQYPSEFKEYEAQERRRESEEEQRISRGFRGRAETRSGKKDKIQQDKDYLASWNAMNRLDKSPDDITRKRAALNVKLRDETGAAIGADEFSNLMSFVLPEDEYQKFRDETTGLEGVMLGMVSNDARQDYLKRIAEDYLGKVDSSRLSEYIDDAISPVYYKKEEASRSPKSNIKPSESDPLGLGI